MPMATADAGAGARSTLSFCWLAEVGAEVLEGAHAVLAHLRWMDSHDFHVPRKATAPAGLSNNGPTRERVLLGSVRTLWYAGSKRNDILSPGCGDEATSVYLCGVRHELTRQLVASTAPENACFELRIQVVGHFAFGAPPR